MYPLPLTAENLTLPRERSYYGWLAFFSVVAWIVLALTVAGLLGALIAAFLAWLANGLLVARLRAESIRVTERQLPELYETHRHVCSHLRLGGVPDLYLLQAGGRLNAFTLRRGGRDFVVIESALLEAYGHASPQIRFALGREIGHIRRNHLARRLFLAPGLILPLLGNAYRRACEGSCDRFGVFAASNIEGAIGSLLTLGGGAEAGRKIDSESFAEQYHAHRGFFVSWHELSSRMPTLSQRVSNLLAIRNTYFRTSPSLHFLAPLAVLFGFAIRACLIAVVIYSVVVAGISYHHTREALSKIRQARAAGHAQPAASVAGDPPLILEPTPSDAPSRPALTSETNLPSAPIQQMVPPPVVMSAPTAPTIEVSPAETPDAAKEKPSDTAEAPSD